MEPNKQPLEKPQVNTFGSIKSKTNLLVIALSITSLLFALSTGFFAYKYLNFQKQPINNSNVGTASSQPSLSKVTFSDVYNQIKGGGSISGIKTINTDNWEKTSDKVTQLFVSVSEKSLRSSKYSR